MFGVLNMGNIVLSTLGIPEEMEIRLCCPVERTGNYYFTNSSRRFVVSFIVQPEIQ